jgi:hypothetical protein
VQSVQTSEWAGLAEQLAESWWNQPGEQEASQLVKLASASAWGPSMSSLADALEDPSWLDSFAGSAKIDIERSVTKPADVPPESTDAAPKSRLLKQAVLPSVATYVVAAVSLHLSNFLSIQNPVFDPHQFITDEYTAIALALTVFGVLWAFVTARKS